MVSEKIELAIVGTIAATMRERFDARLPAARFGT